MPSFSTRQWVPRPVDEVFAFFAEARNLERVTPPFLRFSLCDAGQIAMREGTLIDYKLRLHGIPLRWRSLIEIWEPGARFVDTQVRGPFALWRHEHRFTAAPGGTWIEDRVDFALPLGRLGEIFGGWLVARDVRRIFAFRQQAIEQLFPAPPESAESPARPALQPEPAKDESRA